MKVKAAIALEKAKPLIIDYVDLEGTKKRRSSC
jgi:S-(hydroxymethyl)glutathione dehydrogenase/alcohol dehydrogenase